MIGTTVKLGFDGATVKRGFAGVAAMAKTMGTAIGRGMLERVGHQMTDLTMTLLRAIPDIVKDTADFGGAISDLALATDTSIPTLMKFQEMLRLGGAESVEAGKMLSYFARSLDEAKTSGGAAGDALAMLGLTFNDFDGKTFAEQLEMVMRTMGKSELGFERLSSIGSDLFGARAGYKLLTPMKSFDADSKRAAKSTASLSAYMEKQASNLDALSDALGRWKAQTRLSLGSLFWQQFMRIGDAGTIDKLFDKLDPMKLAPSFERFFSWIGRNVEYILQSGGLWKNLVEGAKGAVKSLGEMIVDSLSALWVKIKEVAVDAGNMAGVAFKKAIGVPNLPSGSDILGGLKGAIGISQPRTSSAADETARQLEEQTRVLKDIRKQGTITVWA